MQDTLSPVLLRRASPVRRLLPIAAILIVTLVMSSPGWADSCSTVSLTLNGMPITCIIPESTPEVVLNSTLTGLSFTTQAQGMVLIYDDSTHTLLSDVLTFTNVAGVATVAFASDTDLGVLKGSGLPILGSFTESNKPISLSLALGNGNFLRVKICSDVNESAGCLGGSDSISLSENSTAVPEPGTFFLLGSGIVGSGAWRLASGRLGRRQLKQIRS